jgi:AraC-like DNA-binding protein
MNIARLRVFFYLLGRTMQITSAALNLSPVYQGLVFQSDEKVASHAHVTSALAEHDLQWRRGTVDAQLCKVRVNRLQLMALRYGAEVEVRPRPFDDFSLVHMSLKGTVEFDTDGERIALPHGRVAIIAPKKNMRMLWGEGCEQLIVKIPNGLLRELRGQTPGHRDGPALPPGLVLSPTFGAQWELLLHSLLNIAALPAHETGYSAWIDHFERNVALFLLTQYQQGAAAVPASAPAPVADDRGAGKRLDALERYMRAKLGAPVALADLAQAAGASVRSLNILCQRHHGVSPMELLRNLRLDAAHAQFAARPGASVAEVALEFGFGHPGRFAGYYKERFGRLPKHVNPVLN